MREASHVPTAADLPPWPPHKVAQSRSAAIQKPENVLILPCIYILRLCVEIIGEANMSDVNRFGLSRHISDKIKRKVRQRYRFGCVVCGSAIIDYEHFDPEFKDATEHSANGIILLCPSHHRQKGSFISPATIKKALEAPKCLQAGFAHGPFDAGDGYPEIVLGTFVGRNVPVLLRVMGEDIFSIKPPEEPGGPFRLSAILRDLDGSISFQIVDNEWQIPDNAWDAVVEGRRVTIRRNHGDIALVFRSEPPGRIVIERLEMEYRGLRLSCREGVSLTVATSGGVMEAQGATVDGSAVGIEVSPDGIGIGVGGGKVEIDQMVLNPIHHPLWRPPKLRRNAPCYCGSGLKFKKCHGRNV